MGGGVRAKRWPRSPQGRRVTPTLAPINAGSNSGTVPSISDTTKAADASGDKTLKKDSGPVTASAPSRLLLACLGLLLFLQVFNIFIHILNLLTSDVSRVGYFTVTLFAKLRGLSGSRPRSTAR